ncbi:DUF948 domain-containing protein [Paenibacillus sp. PAMC21692]|uniref:DUF948 domain-containing protein n=1 Tax=Paenibacillus sp. PAMC21692 TaxID=2762320 RepID=UPI00164E7D4D|nr:DUF948 domain-containing protein [Paenibacillus sp. PAMC21692]QNK59038.1 DUF948 domain-containing protein [Paenibacillus sp. PAMC21692]
MNILIGICLVVITVSLIILVLAVTRTVKQAETFIAETKRTVNELRTEVLQMSSEAREVVQNTNAVTVDARRKLKDLDGLFHTVSDIGEAAHALTTAAKHAAAGVLEKTTAKTEQATRAGISDTARMGHESAGAGNSGAQIRKTAAAIAEMVASSVKIWSRMKAN